MTTTTTDYETFLASKRQSAPMHGKEGLLSEQKYAAFGAGGGERYGVCRYCGLRKQFTVQIIRSAVKNLAEAAW